MTTKYSPAVDEIIYGTEAVDVPVADRATLLTALLDQWGVNDTWLKSRTRWTPSVEEVAK